MEVNEQPYPLSKVSEVPYRSRWVPIFSIHHKNIPNIHIPAASLIYFIYPLAIYICGEDTPSRDGLDTSINSEENTNHKP